MLTVSPNRIASDSISPDPRSADVARPLSGLSDTPNDEAVTLIGTFDPDDAVTLIGASASRPTLSSDGIRIGRVDGVVHVNAIPCLTFRAALAEIARVRGAL